MTVDIYSSNNQYGIWTDSDLLQIRISSDVEPFVQRDAMVFRKANMDQYGILQHVFLDPNRGSIQPPRFFD